MKKMMALLILIGTWSAFAQESKVFYGKATGDARYLRNHYAPDHWTDHLSSVDTKLTTINWGEGKIRVSFQLFGNQYCGNGLEKLLNFVGVDQGFGEYDLYDKTEDLSSASHKAGSLVVSDSIVTLELFQKESIIVTHKPKQCILQTSNGNSFSFEKKCFNRRGKEVKCKVKRE